MADLEARLVHLANLSKRPELIPVELAACAADPVHWISWWAWTYDPRDPLPKQPFNPFPRQIELIDWIREKHLEKQDGIIEKSRDVGVTWICVAYAVWGWLFQEGFCAGFGSRKLDLVDDPGNIQSILEKARFIIRECPRWMQPSRWDPGHCSIVNFDKNSSIIGEGGDHIGRGARTSIYFIDEAAFIQHYELADRALSQVSACRIDISTPNSMRTGFYTRRFSGKIPVFTFLWNQDPRKDQAWYERQKQILDPITLAQEVDIDYGAALEDVLIPNAWVRAAVNFKPKWEDGSEYVSYDPITVGFDVADGGRSKNVAVVKQGPFVKKIQSWDCPASEALWRVVELAEQEQAAQIAYDAQGPGSALGGIINKAERRISQTVKPVNTGASPSRRVWPNGKTAAELFMNMRAEIWWSLRERFRKTWEIVNNGAYYPPDETISIPSDEALISDLSIPRMEITETGKIKVEGKLKMRLRGVASPDHAEALSLAELPADDKFVSDWSDEVHVTEDFEIPETWEWFQALVYDEVGLSVLGLFAESPATKLLFLVSETAFPATGPATVARQIQDLWPRGVRPRYTVANPQVFIQDAPNRRSVDEMFRLNGLPLRVGSKLEGWGIIRDYLKPSFMLDVDGKFRQVSALRIFQSCRNTIEAIVAIRSGDVDDAFVVEDANLRPYADMVRLALLSRPARKLAETNVAQALELRRELKIRKEFPQRPELASTRSTGW